MKERSEKSSSGLKHQRKLLFVHLHKKITNSPQRINVFDRCTWLTSASAMTSASSSIDYFANSGIIHIFFGQDTKRFPSDSIIKKEETKKKGNREQFLTSSTSCRELHDTSLLHHDTNVNLQLISVLCVDPRFSSMIRPIFWQIFCSFM